MFAGAESQTRVDPTVVVPSSRAEMQLSFSPVVKQAAPAVVNVFAQSEAAGIENMIGPELMFERFFGSRFSRPEPRPEQSLGSGVIVSSDGLVVTNAHVIQESETIRIVLSDRREFNAEALLIDQDSDIAVLRLQGVKEPLPALRFGDSDGIEVGDLVLAIGNPFGVGQTVTSGIISARARTGSGGRTFIQTDAAINPGNSGGALVDMQGRLIGVNSAILTRSGGSNGVGFAIPAGLVVQAVAQAKRGATKLSRPWLGVEGEAIDVEIAESIGLRRPQGVMLTRVAPQSPFALAGLSRGSVILSLDGEAIDDMSELQFRVAALGVDAIAEVEALVRGKRQVMQVALIAAPENPPRNVMDITGPHDLSGLVVANLNPALREEIAEDVGAQALAALPEEGVLVLGLSSRARRSGLRPADVVLSYNGLIIERVMDLVSAVRESPRAQVIEVRRRGGDYQILFGG
ncbi:MAG: trypsin-like peptidase domain-containing protein [Rhodobacteraceae bacterium]|nr:trypsin-like peptidase domain-containing protein [Paracoccaceae bacterium]